jgi:hypothetical protein
MSQKGKRSFRISGRVLNRETYYGIEGLLVEAWDKDVIYNDLVGSAITDEQGVFQIEFDESYFSELFLDQRPDLFFKIFRENTLIASTVDSVLWNVEAGDTEILIEVDLPAAREPVLKPDTTARLGREAVTFPINGILINAANGHSLSGLRVKAYFVEPDALKESEHYNGNRQPECLLGEGVSNSSGRFDIVFRNSETVRQRLFLLKGYEGSHVVLKVESSAGKKYHVSDLYSIASRFPITLSIALQAQRIAPSTWRTLGERIEKARLAHLHDLARELAFTPSPHSLFGDWDVETKQSVLTELEQAFLDPQGVLRDIATPPGFYALRVPEALEQYQERLQPQLEDPRVSNALAEMRGKVASFSDLFVVDWLIDPREFQKGNPGAAVRAFQNLYETSIGVLGDVGTLDVQELDQATDLSRYRDYLLAIWASITDPGQDLAPIDLQAQLNRRFHQNFATFDTTERPANEILIPILSDILNAPPGRFYGLGIMAAPRDSRTARQYLDLLISLTHLTAHEIGLRYRVDLERPDSALSSEVQENINTLLGLFRDSFQCEPEKKPYAPFIPSNLLGKAPFFLEYQEWLRQTGPFYAENFYQIRHIFRLEMSAQDQELIRDDIISTVPQEPVTWKFFEDCLVVQALLVAGYDALDHSKYSSALEKFGGAQSVVASLLQDPFVQGLDTQGAFLARRRSHLDDMEALETFMNVWQVIGTGITPGDQMQKIDAGIWIKANAPRLSFALTYLAVYVLPSCIADVAFAQGNYATAVFNYGRTTGFLVGAAKASNPEGYRRYDFDPQILELYHAGNLPYTVEVRELERTVSNYPNPSDDDSSSHRPSFEGPLIPIHPREVKFFRLRQGNAMMEWADALYRTDVPSDIARARELYKGVLWLHGEIPPICPTWADRSQPGVVGFNNHSENPALVSQKSRARRGFFQIEAGLNYYGYRDDMVPVLRYRPLKDAADRFAAFAKSAQQDFLAYMEKLEEATIESIKNASMLKKAGLQAEVAGEQSKIAQDGVALAKIQIAQVNQAIAAKQKEIDDHDSLFTQFTDYIGGMVKIVKDLPSDTQSSVSSGLGSAAGVQDMKGSGFLGLGEAGSILGGFGIFAVASYMTMSSMEGAANQRNADLAKLKDQALPAATTQLDIKKREETISLLQRRLAQADGDLAQDLITFQSNRFLNTEFWSNLANVMKRVLRRYLELGARAAWFAERALAYEQDRSLNIIRFDYFPESLQGVTGADLLQLDVAELEASRLDGIKETIPIKHTYSMARDFPLQFGQLKQTGRCTFRTEELPFRFAHPGTYSYRIRAVTVTVNNVAVTAPVRGLLTNHGVSMLSRFNDNGNEETHVSMRPADAFPISEFRLSNDMAVYSLPDEALMPFEGSGVETFWQLEFPSVANPYGLDNVADILLTFDVRGHYSAILYQRHLASVPTSIRRLVFASALRYQSQSLVELHGSASQVNIDFNMALIGLPQTESNRKVKNLVLFLIGEKPLTFMATFRSSVSPKVNVFFEKSIAISNASPLSDAQSSAPLSPLNALVDKDVAQTFRLTINKSTNPGVDLSKVSDVILGVEYTADLK